MLEQPPYSPFNISKLATSPPFRPSFLEAPSKLPPSVGVSVYTPPTSQVSSWAGHQGLQAGSLLCGPLLIRKYLCLLCCNNLSADQSYWQHFSLLPKKLTVPLFWCLDYQGSNPVRHQSPILPTVGICSLGGQWKPSLPSPWWWASQHSSHQENAPHGILPQLPFPRHFYLLLWARSFKLMKLVFGILIESLHLGSLHWNFISILFWGLRWNLHLASVTG